MASQATLRENVIVLKRKEMLKIKAAEIVKI
jgi:hypothetical protein